MPRPPPPTPPPPAAYVSQGKRLRRTRGGFAGLPAEIKTSGAVTTQVFTRRVINWLDDAYLVTFDALVLTSNPDPRIAARGNYHVFNKALLERAKAVTA